MALKARRTLAPVPASAAAARAFTAETLGDWGCDRILDVAQLLVSELVTNVVLHAGTDALVELSLDEELLRIEVSDGSRRSPVQRTGHHSSVGGRGIPIVEVVGDNWGVNERADGKTVWTELYLR
jgi:anti-sigma regulatory factor (Ser/Thr protein kinase)